MSRSALPVFSPESSSGCPEVTRLVSGEGEGERPCFARHAEGFRKAVPAPFGVVGLSHRTAPLEMRSRVGVGADGVAPFLAAARKAGLKECVLLSTCNRTEIYYNGAEADLVAALLAQQSEVPLDELRPYLYAKSCVCAACHLFRVAAGLDSAVLGETEIVAQVKEAWRIASQAKASGGLTDLLFQKALEASKRIRTETDLCRSVTSTGSLAVREAETRLGGLSERRVLLLGAGKIAERVAKELAGASAGDVRILNRTPARGQELAARIGATSRPFDELEAELAEADVVFATLGVERPALTGEALCRTMRARNGRSLLIVDLGVPGNVEAGVSGAGLEVLDLDTLVATCSANSDSRASAVPAALEILDQELEKFGAALAERAAAPTIRALVERGDAIRQRNVDWARERLVGLNDREMRIVEEMARRLTIGLLQAPIEGLKGDPATREHRELVERLFGIERSERDR